MNRTYNSFCNLSEYEVIDSGPITTNAVLYTECFNADNEIIHSGKIEGITRMFMFNSGDGINICMHYPNQNLVDVLTDEIPTNSDYFKCKFCFESIFGPAEFSFESKTIPLITHDVTKQTNSLFGNYGSNRATYITSIMFYTNNNLGLSILNAPVKEEHIKKLLVFSDGTKLNKNPFDVCKELAGKMNSPTWFDDVREKDALNTLNNKKNNIIQKVEDRALQAKRDKINNSISEATTQANGGIESFSLTVKSGSKTPLEDLDKMVGLEKVKKAVKKLYYKQKFDNSLYVKTDDDTSLHMCFLGNPGTGKTTIARIITGILYEMKYIKHNRCVEVNGLDLIGNYVGQTGIITKKVIDASRGGVLFVDEAYVLNSKSNPFGTEAISVLLKEMEDNRDDVVVILAGYKDPMNQFLDMNSGFRSRINRYFEFEDYAPDELFAIFEKELKERGYSVEPGNLPLILSDFYKASKEENFSNGRYVRNYVERLEEKHIGWAITEIKVKSSEVDFDFASKKFIRRIRIVI